MPSQTRPADTQGQHRRLVRPRVQRAAIIVAIPESPPIEQARDPRLHGGQHFRHVQRREARRGMKAHDTGAVPGAHPIEDQRVDMHGRWRMISAFDTRDQCESDSKRQALEVATTIGLDARLTDPTTITMGKKGDPLSLVLVRYKCFPDTVKPE